MSGATGAVALDAAEDAGDEVGRGLIDGKFREHAQHLFDPLHLLKEFPVA